MQTIELPYNFNPRAYQLEIMRKFYVDKILRLILVQHRRAGKDLLCLNVMVTAALKRVGTYVYALPMLKQARKVMWEGMDKSGNTFLSYIPPCIISGKPHDTRMTVYLKNGSIITFTGADNYDALMGTNPIGLVLSEHALQHPYVWHYMSPILRENKGWVIFNGTPRGHNHAYELYNRNFDNPDWYVVTHDITKTEIAPGIPVVTEADIEEELRAGMRPELIQQEYYCSFDMPIPGAYYSEQMMLAHEEGRIEDFEISKDHPIFTFWDLGYTDACAVTFFQMIGGEVKIINYYERTQQEIKHVCKYVHDFAKKNGLTFKMHFAPHDIMQGNMLGGKRGRIQEARKNGIRFHVVPVVDKNKKKIKIIDGINAVRDMFPRFYFHKTNCDLLIRAMNNYHCHYSEIFGIEGDHVHDWSCHGADTMRYFATMWSDRFVDERSFMSGREMIDYQSSS